MLKELLNHLERDRRDMRAGQGGLGHMQRMAEAAGQHLCGKPVCLEDLHGVADDLHPILPNVVRDAVRSEEHTSELQSHSDLVCRLLLEKKKENYMPAQHKR